MKKLLIALSIVCLMSGAAIAKEWRAGVAFTFPLGGSRIMERSTMTVHAEVYDADIYKLIDQSINTEIIDQSVHNSLRTGNIRTSSGSEVRIDPDTYNDVYNRNYK